MQKGFSAGNLSQVQSLSSDSVQQAVAESFGIYCIGTGRVTTAPQRGPKTAPGQATLAKRTQFGLLADEAWRLVYITDGEAVQIEPGVDRSKGYSVTVEPAGPGSVILMEPGDRSNYKANPLTGLTEHWVAFDGIAVQQRFFCTSLRDLGPVTQIGLHAEIVELYERMYEYASLNTPEVQREIGATIVLLVARMITYAKYKNKLPYHAAKIEEAKAIIVTHLRSRVQLSDIARQIGMGASTFRRAFLRVTGTTPYQYFLIRKVALAKQLLMETDSSIGAIASELGFADQYHFSRVFHKYAGVSPTRWRSSPTSEPLRTD